MNVLSGRAGYGKIQVGVPLWDLCGSGIIYPQLYDGTQATKEALPFRKVFLDVKDETVISVQNRSAA